ncbi:MAG: radical SAM protein [Lachnospiraceae bacterium]|nr:radical SAM protein [Lachnospiraceae bacterium]MCM1230743.1 radical SAM protein [Ruminococcus flavefaciens]
MKNYEDLPMFLTEDGIVDFWDQWDSEHPFDKGNHQLYIHYPWCKSICKFCVFGQCKYSDYKDMIPYYEEAMLRQLRKFDNRKTLDGFFHEVYLGGGTASLWSRNFLQKLWDMEFIQDEFFNMEIHPNDLTDDYIKFIMDLRPSRVSMGVQTFDEFTLKRINRLPQDTMKILVANDNFRATGIETNIDLIAIPDKDMCKEPGWGIFRRDLKLAAQIEPDSIFVEPNFRLGDFYLESIRFRTILKEFLENNPSWFISNPDALKCDIEDVIRYRDLPYELLNRNGRYGKYTTNFGSKVFVWERMQETIVGLGGINDFTAYSKTPDGFYINSKYIPHDKELIYTLTKHNKFTGLDDQNDLYNTRVQVGSYTITPPKRISE